MNANPDLSTSEGLASLRLRQRESWERGERLTVENLIQASGAENRSDEALLELILSEFQLRKEFGESPSTEEYMRRFPQLQERLERLFTVCALIDDTDTGYFSKDRTHASPAALATSETAPWIAAGARLGSYHLLEKIGEGGMGVVYKARHEKLKKVVALKVVGYHLARKEVKKEDVDALTARFTREIEAVGLLDHPNIVRATDAGEIEGKHFLVMEFIEGSDLGTIVKSGGPLDVDEACSFIQQAAAGMQHAHDHRLVHRDLKPQNLMCTRDRSIKVLDLGLARLRAEIENTNDRGLSDSGQPLGTFDYISPEQTRNPKAVDGRADIYSLGCTLYFLLTGKPMYVGSLVEKLLAHCEAPIPSLRTARQNIPVELDRVFQKMVAKKLDDRYASMSEVINALGSVHSRANLLTPKPHSSHRWIIGSAAAALLVLVAIGYWQWGQRNYADQKLSSDAQTSAHANLASKQVASAAAPPIAPLEITSFLVERFLDKDLRNPVGVVGTHTFRTIEGDSLRIEARFRRPAYCYLIAFNADGAEQLCHPAEQDIAPQVESELSYAFGLTDGPGEQAFVLVASETTLPAYREWRAQLDETLWTSSPPSGDVLRFDGRDVQGFSEKEILPRGTVRPLKGSNEFSDLCQRIKSRSETELVQAIAFPVEAK